MILKTSLSADELNGLAYPDFVGHINQWNVLPGAYSTINQWATFGHVRSDSKVLQVACTTGFQARELSVITGCTSVGFDRSEVAVKRARDNLEDYAPQADVSYVCADGYDFDTSDRFTHIAVGGGLRFFPDPEAMMTRALSFLSGDGYVLASPFWVVAPIPDTLLAKASSVFGITPTKEGYKEVMRLYKDLEIIYENKQALELETDEELEEYCTHTIDRAARKGYFCGPEAEEAAFKRLREIRAMSNELRSYQEYSVLVLRYRGSTYPSRYVELF
jgi:ubiquinone/menaquinone biosynthesis C-methylase UbiE